MLLLNVQLVSYLGKLIKFLRKLLSTIVLVIDKLLFEFPEPGVLLRHIGSRYTLLTIQVTHSLSIQLL
ncbi:hypothetical protein D3C85_1512140 [compost metagenome]